MNLRKNYETWKPLIHLLMLVVAFLLAFLISHHLAPRGSAESTSGIGETQIDDGVKEITTLSEADLDAIESKLETVEAKESSKNLNSGNFNAIFSNAGFMGDSMAEGFSAFGLLSSSRVGAVKGHGLTNYQADLTKMQSLSPKYLFINYGLNNMGTYKKNTDRFVSDYEKLIEKVQETLPKAEIFILNIMPVQKEALTSQPYLGYTDAYNKALKEMCESLDLTFIDSSSVVKEEYYAKDHIHMGTGMHAEWLKDIAAKAGLTGTEKTSSKTSTAAKTEQSTSKKTSTSSTSA